jgi:hypothetical protein
MGYEKTCEIIKHRLADSAVCTSRPVTARHHIPECYAVSNQQGASEGIGKLVVNGKNAFYYLPELVPGISIVFVTGKRSLAGKTSEDQDTRVVTAYRLKALCRGMSGSLPV